MGLRLPLLALQLSPRLLQELLPCAADITETAFVVLIRQKGRARCQRRFHAVSHPTHQKPGCVHKEGSMSVGAEPCRMRLPVQKQRRDGDVLCGSQACGLASGGGASRKEGVRQGHEGTVDRLNVGSDSVLSEVCAPGANVPLRNSGKLEVKRVRFALEKCGRSGRQRTDRDVHHPSNEVAFVRLREWWDVSKRASLVVDQPEEQRLRALITPFFWQRCRQTRLRAQKRGEREQRSGSEPS